MPWQLTTPINVGDLDTGSYAQVKISRFAHDSVRKIIAIDLEYGNTVDGQWRPGYPPRTKPTSVFVQGDDYLALVLSEPEVGEKTYEAVQRGLYSYLAEKDQIGPGQVV